MIDKLEERLLAMLGLKQKSILDVVFLVKGSDLKHMDYPMYEWVDLAWKKCSESSRGAMVAILAALCRRDVELAFRLVWAHCHQKGLKKEKDTLYSCFGQELRENEPDGDFRIQYKEGEKVPDFQQTIRQVMIGRYLRRVQAVSKDEKFDYEDIGFSSNTVLSKIIQIVRKKPTFSFGAPFYNSPILYELYFMTLCPAPPWQTQKYHDGATLHLLRVIMDKIQGKWLCGTTQEVFSEHAYECMHAKWSDLYVPKREPEPPEVMLERAATGYYQKKQREMEVSSSPIMITGARHYSPELRLSRSLPDERTQAMAKEDSLSQSESGTESGVVAFSRSDAEALLPELKPPFPLQPFKPGLPVPIFRTSGQFPDRKSRFSPVASQEGDVGGGQRGQATVFLGSERRFGVRYRPEESVGFELSSHSSTSVCS